MAPATHDEETQRVIGALQATLETHGALLERIDRRMEAWQSVCASHRATCVSTLTARLVPLEMCAKGVETLGTVARWTAWLVGGGSAAAAAAFGLYQAGRQAGVW